MEGKESEVCIEANLCERRLQRCVCRHCTHHVDADNCDPICIGDLVCVLDTSRQLLKIKERCCLGLSSVFVCVIVFVPEKARK